MTIKPAGRASNDRLETDTLLHSKCCEVRIEGIDVVEEALLLAPASKGGMPCVEWAVKPNLSAHSLPPATSFVAESLYIEIAAQNLA